MYLRSTRVTVTVFLAALCILYACSATQAKYITIMAPGGAELKTYLDEIVKDFRKDYPKVEVRILQFNAQEQIDKTSVMLVGGLPPEVIWTSNRYSANWFDKKIFKDLRPYMKRDKIQPTSFITSAYKDLTVEGQQYGLPIDVGVMMMMFYPRAFAQAGLSTPIESAINDRWSYDAWVKALQRLTLMKAGTSTPSQWGYFTQVSYTPEIADWMCAAGGRLLSADKSKSLVHEPKPLEGIGKFLELRHKYKVAVQGGVANVAEDKVAMWYGSQNWAAVLAKKGTIDYAFRPVPTSDLAPRSTLLVNHLGIFKTCREPDLGWEFIKRAMSLKWQSRLGEMTGRVPGLLAAMPLYLKTIEKQVVHPQVLSKTLTEYSEGLPVNKWWMRVQNTLEPIVLDAWNKNRDIASMLSAASKQLDVVLKENAVKK